MYNTQAQAETTNSGLENKYTHIHDSQFKRKFLNIVSGNIHENLTKAVFLKSRLTRDSDLDDKLLDEQKSQTSLQEYENMLKFRMKLPAYKMREEILQVIKENQVVVISGETGKFVNGINIDINCVMCIYLQIVEPIPYSYYTDVFQAVERQRRSHSFYLTMK